MTWKFCLEYHTICLPSAIFSSCHSRGNLEPRRWGESAMTLRQDTERTIEKTKADIRKLELELYALQGYLRAYEETLKRIIRDEESSGSQAERALRAGSSVAKARDAIKKAGKALRIEDILKAVGKPADKKNRISLSGSLAHYVRNGQIFTRPEPNTFGLTEFDRDGEEHDSFELHEEPEKFGGINGKTTGIR